MKKTYIIPEIVCVSITHQLPIATSDPNATLNTSAAAVDGGDLDVKSVSDVNVWDDEW